MLEEILTTLLDLGSIFEGTIFIIVINSIFSIHSRIIKNEQVYNRLFSTQVLKSAKNTAPLRTQMDNISQKLRTQLINTRE